MDWKRAAFGVVGTGLTGVAGVVALVAWTFSGMGAIVDGQELPGGIRVVEDGYVSAFVVPLADGTFALVDAGNDPEGKALLEALRLQGAGPDDVTAILLTHGHADHVAACGRFPRATTYAAADELPLVRGEVRSKGPLPRWFATTDSGCPRLTAVSDGEALTLGGTTATLYAVPGHTAGSAAWRVGSVLFLGDSADAANTGALLPAKWVFSDDGAANRAALQALADRLQGTGLEQLAFAHSGTLPASALLGSR
jgi:glyoxylase-like metal-dependent hydrolase (beta-lactamase superfamily II)